MSEQFNDEFDAEEAQYEEEISTVEVDRVLETLSDLMENVESETIHDHLEEAYNQVFALVYEDEDEVDDDGEVATDEEYDEYEELDEIEVEDDDDEEQAEAA